MAGGFEIGPRTDVEGDPGIGAFEIGPLHRATTHTGVIEVYRIAFDAFQDHKVVEFPVNDQRKFFFSQFFGHDAVAHRFTAQFARGAEHIAGFGAVTIDPAFLTQLLQR